MPCFPWRPGPSCDPGGLPAQACLRFISFLLNSFCMLVESERSVCTGAFRLAVAVAAEGFGLNLW